MAFRSSQYQQSKDDQGSTPLSPKETADLDQIEAGLKDSKGPQDPKDSSGTDSKKKPNPFLGSNERLSEKAHIQRRKDNGDTNVNLKRDQGSRPSSAPAKGSSPPGGSPIGGSKGGGDNNWANFRAGVGKRRKSLTYALIAAVIAAIVAGGVDSLIPFKLESMMKNILKNRIESRVRHYVVKRIFGPRNLINQYTKASVGKSDAEFEKSIANLDEPTKELMRNWRKPTDGGDPLETRLLKDQKLKLAANGGTVDVIKDGVHVGTVDDPKAFSILSSDLFDQAHNFNVIERDSLRKMMSVLYSISSWSFFHKKDGADAAKEVPEERIDNAVKHVQDSDTAILDCVLGTVTGGANCPTDEGNPNADDRTGVADTSPSDTGNSHDGDVGTAVSDGSSTATQKVKDLYNKVADHVVPGRILSRVLSKYLSDEIALAVSKAFAAAKGPLIIISALDIAARIDHFLWYGTADKVLVQAHKVQYAAEFTQWTTINDNRNDGHTVTPAENNAVAGMLDGTEKSAASKSVYGTGTGGQSLTTVSDGKGGTVSDPTARSIDEQQHPIEDVYRFTLAVLPISGTRVWHYVAEAWLATGAHVWAVLNTVISLPITLILDALKAIPIIGEFIDWITNNISDLLAKLVVNFLGAAVDGTETGADLFNQIDAGGAVVGMDFSRWLGGDLLSGLAARQVNDEIAQENAAQNAQLSLRDRLFSTDNPNSMVSRLVLQMPTTPAGALSDSADFASSLVSNPYQAMAPILRLFGVGTAQALNDMPGDYCGYGLNCWGYTDAQLNQDDHGAALHQAFLQAQTRLGKTDVSLGEMQLSDCPAVDPPHTAIDKLHPNLCRLDLATLQSMNADFTHDDDGGLNSGGGAQ